MESNTKLTCRKCGGNHLTIKCGKTNNLDNQQNDIKDKNKYNDRNNKPNDRNNNKYTVKISNLPKDLKEYEIVELLKDWGHISKINLKNYEESSIAYVDFKYKDESEYFIKALDNTPFEYKIINIIYLE